MKKVFGTIGVVVAIAFLTGMASSATAASALIELQDPPGRLLVLDVGESHTFDIEIQSDEPFILAMAMPDVYYPGRAIEFRGNDIALRGESALLQLMMTGKGSTADFEQVCGWPEPETECWPAGTVPVSIVVGVRYKANEVVMERFTFAVKVPGN